MEARELVEGGALRALEEEAMVAVALVATATATGEMVKGLMVSAGAILAESVGELLVAAVSLEGVVAAREVVAVAAVGTTETAGEALAGAQGK